ncbi:putative arsenite efflux transporter [Acephala macrosclerotiorum]|nr:putative arsenite efflux transporter [Acephala macrosclerotiorum]
MSSATQILGHQSSEIDPDPEKTISEPDPPSSLKHDLELQHSSNTTEENDDMRTSAFKSLGLLDRYLAVWILLSMAVDIILGNFFVGVSIPIAVGLLVVMYSILCKVRFESLHHVFRERKIWLGLTWAFLPDKPGLREGLILVGLARCITMVLIWTGLAGGDTEYCAMLVAINSILQMVLFAPLAILVLRVISGADATVSYEVIAKSVVVFLRIPLGAAVATRFSLQKLISPDWYERVFVKLAAPCSLIGLLFTILVLFASRGHQVVHQIVSVLQVSAPLMLYFGVITLLVTHKLGFGYKLAATQSFTAASNNFELAIAVAVATYGQDSDQAPASTVGLVYVVKAIGRRRGWKD